MNSGLPKIACRNVSYSLSQTLLGQDIVFRVLNKSQYSILNADGLEFINIENRWKFRDYNVLVSFFKRMVILE